MALEIDRTMVDGKIAVLEMHGRIVLGTGSATLRDTVKNELANQRSKIALVLEDVTFIDSSGWGTLVSAYTLVANAGGELVLVKPSRKVVETGTINKLIGVYKTFDSTDEAVAYFKADLSR